jgi:shikimate kinase
MRNSQSTIPHSSFSIPHSLKLYLIGMPGSGKTTLGQQLARHYGFRFLDLDAEIERRAGRSIPTIFKEEGEAEFRRQEAEVLRAVAARPEPAVVATGGGTPCFHDNMTVLNQSGLTFWLDVPVPVLAARLRAPEQASRPLLATASGEIEQWLVETLTARTRFYEQARLRCPAAACTVPEIVAQLAANGFPARG